MNRRLLLHILFWIIYILFESYLEYSWISVKYTQLGFLQHCQMAFGGEVIICLAKIPLSYFVIRQLNHFNANSSPLYRIILFTLAGFVLSILLYRVIVYYWILPYIYMGLYGPQPLFGFEQNVNAFLDLVFCCMIVVAAKQYRLAESSRKKADMLSKERLEAELKFLRAQTNPHFLFNTLNNIYALARKKSDLTADAVMRLSKLLRFMLYESGNGLISIANEVKVLNDYIELEKIRYNNRLKIQLIQSIDNEQQSIIPLILLPFVDNAFKHGASESRFDSFIDIYIEVKKGQLLFIVKNSKEDDGRTDLVESIGLGNVQRQLQLVYPEHDLKIEKRSDTFTITLTINLLLYATV